MRIVIPSELELRVCRDPDDDNILAAAESGKCDCINYRRQRLAGAQGI